MASKNRDWGYDRIVGALANLGYVISDPLALRRRRRRMAVQDSANRFLL